MNCLRFIRGGLVSVLLMSSLSVLAQNATYEVALDTDRDETTGCSLTPSSGTPLSGIESRLQATVDLDTLTVTDVALLRCTGSGFSMDSSLDGGYPVALDQGMGGADAVELAVGQFAAAPESRGSVRLGFLADDGAGSDALTRVDGNTDGTPIFLNTPYSVPGLTVFGLLLLAVLLVVAAWFANRRAGQAMTISAVMLVALAAWASQHAADGNLGEWMGMAPRAQDPAGDASNGSSALDIRAAYAVVEDQVLYFRIDLADLENEAPEVFDDAHTTDEDTTLNVAAPGVLDNDSDPEGDPITAVLDTPPANADSFSLNADGSFDYTPQADFNGSDSFTYFANDGQTNSVAATVTITINAVNDAPDASNDTASANEDQSVDIDVLANDSDVDGDLDPASVSVTTPPANGTTVVNPANGVITYTTSGDFNGSDSFGYEVCDDGSPTPVECATATVDVTVDPVNDAPSFTAGGDITVDEDSGGYNTAWAGAIDPGAANESGQLLSFNVTANDNPGLFASGPVIDASSGNLSFTPAADANGSASITVELSDDGGTANGGDDTSAPVTFVVTVDPVNDAPTFTTGGDVDVNEDSGTYSAAWATDLSAGPGDESGQTLIFSVTGNDNPGLFASAPAVDNAGNLSFTPAADAFGSATITVELADDGGTAGGGSDTSAPIDFIINVNAVNDEPSFTAGGSIGIDEDSGVFNAAWASAIDPGASNEGGQALTFNVTANDNPSLFSSGPSIDAAGNLSFTPAADANGSANITVELADDGGTANGGDDTSAAANFAITVSAVNDAPTFVSGGNVVVLEDSGAYSQGWAGSASAGPADEAGQTLTFSVTGNDNPGLFAVAPAVDNSGNLSFTPAGDAFGTANITVELSDDGGTSNGGTDTSAPANFTITLTPVNDPPSFNSGGDVTVNEDSGVYAAAWASAITPGAPNETGQALTFSVTGNDNPSLFSAAPAVDAAGNLGFTPAANAFGTANITLELSDDGGTANGGVDTSSPPVSFVINVEPVNDPPVVNAPGPFNVTGNVQIQVPDGVDDLLSGVSDPADGGSASPFSITTGNVTSTQGGDVVINADGSFSYDPPAGYEGADGFQFEVCDSGVPLPSACTTASVSLTVSDMVWFVDSSLPSAGDGRLSSPFNDIDALDAVNDGAGNHPAIGEPIFLYSGTHDGQLALLDGQRVFGQGAAATLASLTGISLPTHSDAFPATGGTLPVWTAGNATALTLAANNTLRGFEIGNTGTGTDIAGSNFGTLTVSELLLSGSGQALNLDTGTLVDGAGTPGFMGITSTSGSRNISLTGISGSPTLGSGSLSGATGPAFYVDGGTGNFSYPGSITNTTSRVVEVRNRTAGTITLSGNLGSSGAGTGILVTNNSGGTVTFSGPGKTLSTGVAGAVTLSNNTGSTIRFSNGGLDIDTTSGTGFSASGGGTVEVTGAANSVTTATGTGVTISDTQLGLLGVVFRDISVNGAANGIRLVNTGSTGDFLVTGDGTLARNGSGGTIQNTTDDGVYLENASNIVLQQIDILDVGNAANPGDIANATNDHAVESRGGGDITLSAVLIRNPIGTGWEAFDITGDNAIDNGSLVEELDRTSNFAGLRVTNTNVTFAGMSITDSTFDHADPTPGDPANNGNAMIVISTRGSAGGTFNVDNSTFTGARGTAITVNSGDTAGSSGALTSNIRNSTFDNAHPINGQNNVGMQAIQATTHNMLADGNLLQDVGRGGSLSGQVIMQKSNTAVLDAQANNNVVSGVPSQHGLDALSLSTSSGGRVDWEADSNTIFNVGRRGIFNSARGNEPDMDIAMRNNTVGRDTFGVVDPVGFDTTIQRGIEIDVQTAAYLQGIVTNNEVVANTSGSVIGGLASAVMFVNVEEFPSGTATGHITFDGNTFTNQDATGSPNVLARTRDESLTLGLDFNLTTANGASSSILVEEYAASTVTLEDQASIAGDNPGITTFNIGVGVTDHGGNIPEPDF